jgi:hypothetical protein
MLKQTLLAPTRVVCQIAQEQEIPMMRKEWIVFAVYCLLAAPGAVAAQADATAEARAAAESWLAIIDGDDYAASWEEAARAFRSAITAEAWTAQLTPLRAQLGTVEERELAHSQAMTDPPRAAAGEYMQLQYQSTFSSAGRAIENVVLMRDGDRGWRVAGYFLQPSG